VKRRQGLRRQSAKRRAGTDERREVREAVFRRDGHRCRIAPFLPDMECSTAIEMYEPGEGGEPVTACSRHAEHCRTHPQEARGLGLT
jgi:hypothetical protein